MNPEVVEKDITIMRTSPLPFSIAKIEVKTDEQISTPYNGNQNFANIVPTPPANFKTENCSSVELIPFPNIPAEIEQPKNLTSLFQPSPRKFEPVSLTGKKYTIKEPKFETTSLKSQYNFALADTEYKVVERAYSQATANNIKSLQSEIFESQGHFNASRSCSPFPVYIPVSREPTPAPNKQQTNQDKNLTKIDLSPCTDQDDAIEMPHVESNAEKRLRESTITGNETVSEIVKSQQKCFSELRDVQFCYAVANGSVSEMKKENPTFDLEGVKIEENEIQKRLKEMKNVREGKCGDSSSHTADISTNVNGETPANGMETVADLKISNAVMKLAEPVKNVLPAQSQNTSKEEQGDGVYEEEKVPELLCKKPPDAIIGARPLFGQLDITSEFKKALVGRSKSLQSRRYRSENKVEKHTAEPKINIEKCENIETEDITEHSKLSTQMKDTTKAEITKFQPNEYEEIEKIYFQQEREYEVDVQTTSKDLDLPAMLQNIGKPDTVEYFGPNSYAVSNTDDVAISISQPVREIGISRSSRVSENLNACEKTSDFMSNHQEYCEENEYRKVPVKSLIKNFEQCSMPAMRYKKIRDPLPDIVEKLSNTKRQTKEYNYEAVSMQQSLAIPTSESETFSNSASQDVNLRKAEEEFDHLFYVANSSVKTIPYFPKMEIQNFQQSENSSFCKYSSHANLSQNFVQNPPQSFSYNATQNTAMEVIESGKLCLY